MAWISIEVIPNGVGGSKVKDIKGIRILTDDNGEPAIFEHDYEIAEFERKNAVSKAVYSMIEVWS